MRPAYILCCILLLVPLVAGCGGGGGHNGGTNPPPTVGQLSIPSNPAVVPTEGVFRFTATFDGEPYTAVIWSVKEGDAAGAFSSGEAGLYTAPLHAGTFHAVATAPNDPSLTATAEVIVVPWSDGGSHEEGGYRLVAMWGAEGGADFKGRGQFRDPRGLGIDPAGNVYVSDAGIGTIQKFSNDGIYISEWAPRGVPWDWLGPMAISSQGQIFMLFGLENAYRNMYTWTNGSQSYWGLSAWTGDHINNKRYSCAAFDLAVTGSMVYVSEVISGTSHVIVCYPGSPGSYAGAVAWPTQLTGMAIDGMGNVYVADRANGVIHKFHDSFTGHGRISLDHSGVEDPCGIEVDAGGYIYVADIKGNAVYKFSPEGYLITKFGNPGTEPGQLSRPTFVKVDASGNVFVLDKGNRRVLKFQPL